MKVAGRNTIYRVFKGSFHDWLRGVDFFRKRQILDSSCNIVSSAENSKKENSNANMTKDLYALNIMSLNEFKKSKEPKITDFICNKENVKIEIGQGLKSEINRDQARDQTDAPIYIKVNNEYSAVVSPKDIFW